MEENLGDWGAAAEECVHQRRAAKAVHRRGVHALLQEPLSCRKRALCRGKVQRRPAVIVPHVTDVDIVLQASAAPL